MKNVKDRKHVKEIINMKKILSRIFKNIYLDKNKKLIVSIGVASGLLLVFGSILAHSEKISYLKIEPTASPIPNVIPTSAPLQTLVTITESPTTKTQAADPTNTPTPTPTPTPTVFKPGPFMYKNAEFSSHFIEVSVGPGEEANAFTIKSNGAHEYIINALRIFGVSGLSLYPTQEIMTSGDIKQVKLRADQSSAPGTYSGFIDMEVDGDDLVLNITVTVVGSQLSDHYIKVTAPKGGETYKEGDTITIEWESKGAEIQNITIVSENGQALTTGAGLSANGSYQWRSEKYFDPNATHFKFYVNGNSGSGFLKGESGFVIIN